MPSREKPYVSYSMDSNHAKRERALKVLAGRRGDELPNRAIARLAEVSENMIRNVRRALGKVSPVPPVGLRLVKDYVPPRKKTAAPKVKAKGAKKKTRPGGKAGARRKGKK